MAEHGLPWGGRLGRQTFDYVVTRLDDRARIREFLRKRVEYSAYALGQLEPGLFERTQWFYARGDTGSGLVLHSRGGLGEAMFSMGDPDAVAAVLSIEPGPSHTYATCEPGHTAALQTVYRLASQQPMMRMHVNRAQFRPVESNTIALNGFDIRRLNGLYASDGAPSYYVPEHIDAGLYRGIFVEGRLVSVAGTHVVSRHEGVAVVGNVFTQRQHRGKGYATATTSAVTAALLEFCEDVVLTVDPGNRPAVRAYEHLGYREACRLVEASATRRDPTGIAAAFRRVRATVRGRRYGGSFVSLRPS
ncbi:MAG: GNAT family N-acetyltransferase [Dehalococcoidia bacterium]